MTKDNPIYDALVNGHPSQTNMRGLVDVTHMSSHGPIPIVTHKGPNRKQRRAAKKPWVWNGEPIPRMGR